MLLCSVRAGSVMSYADGSRCMEVGRISGSGRLVGVRGRQWCASVGDRLLRDCWRSVVSVLTVMRLCV